MSIKYFSIQQLPAVEEAEAGGFEEMGGENVGFGGQVGDGSGNLEDAGVGTCG